MVFKRFPIVLFKIIYRTWEKKYKPSNKHVEREKTPSNKLAPEAKLQNANKL